MVCCEETILREIADETMKQKDIAMTYRLAMESEERDKIDWAKINGAIMARWSKTGLIAIKKSAHSGKCFAPKTA
jgi:hypothetical protein